jgi:Transglycosylase SLT domain
MVNVPSQYQQYITEASQGTGLPFAVEAAQASDESGFQPSATSGAGAEGFWQFLPSTFNDVAAAAGVPQGTEYNIADETKAYIVYMNQLLTQFHGNVQDALAAYNAGPGNIQAGMGYANSILAGSGQTSSLTVGAGKGVQGATLTSFPGGPADPLNWPSIVSSSVFAKVLSVFGITPSSIGDILERGALMVFGGVLVILGVMRLTEQNNSGNQKQQTPQTQQKQRQKEPEQTNEETPEEMPVEDVPVAE